MRVLKWLGLACLAIVLVLIAALGALHTPSGRNFVRSRVASLLALQQINFNADQLSYNLFDLSLDLRDVTIKSARRESDPPFAFIKHLKADLSLRDLIRGRYVVEAGLIEGTRVHYLIDENGDNLPRPPSDPNAPGQELDYLIAGLTLADAQVRYDNRAQQLDATISITSVTVSGDRATSRHIVSVTANGGRVLARGRDVQLAHLGADLVVGKDDVEITRATLEAEGSRFELRGKLAQFANPVIDVNLQAIVDAARAGQLAGLADRVGGRVTIDGSAKGRASAPTVEARIAGRSIAFRTIELLSLDADVGYSGDAHQLTARSVEASAPWGRVAGSGQVSLERGASRASVRASGVDLAPLMRAFGLDMTIASRVDAEANLTWPVLDYAAASGTADVTQTNAHARFAFDDSSRRTPLGPRQRLASRCATQPAGGGRSHGERTGGPGRSRASRRRSPRNHF